MKPLRRAARSLGWTLMGYPAAVGWRKWVIDPVPGWSRVYRLGARISDWGYADGVSWTAEMSVKHRKEEHHGNP